MRKLILLCLVLFSAIQSQALFGQCNEPFPLSTGPQACLDAPLFCANADLDGYCSATGNTGVGVCPPPFCSGCQNFQWFKFVANTQVLAILEINPEKAKVKVMNKALIVIWKVSQ